jgi:prophage regulatory protein
VSRRFIRIRVVKDRTGMSVPTIYRLVAAGKFPPPVRLAPNVSAWIEDEVTEWSDQRIAERDRDLGDRSADHPPAAA